MSDPKVKVVIDLDATRATQGLRTFREGMASVSTLLEQLTRLGAVALSFTGISTGLKGLADASDRIASVNARLKLATQGQGEYTRAQAQTLAIANRNLVATEAVATLYTRLAGAVRQLKGDQTAALQITEAVATGIRITGATASESSSAILQFAQAMGSGVLRGEEFNAVNEAAPRLMQALADGMAVPQTALRGLAEQGKLTADVVGNALISQLARLKVEAASLPLTVAGAGQLVGNAFDQFVSKSGQIQGKINLLASVLKLAADNMNLLGSAALFLAGALAALAAGKIVSVLLAMGAGLVAGSAATGGLAAAFGRLAAVLGGPTGIIVAIGTFLAGAWLTAESAADKYKKKSDEVLAADVERLKRMQRAEADRPLRDSRVGRELQTARSPVTQELAVAEAEIARRAQAEQDGKELSRESRRGRAGILRSSLGQESLKEKFTARLFIEKEYQDARVKIAQAAAADIERADGNSKQIGDIRKIEIDQLKDAKQKRDAAISGFSKNEALTRLAQYKADFDQQLALSKDFIEREKALNQERFDQGLQTAAQYFSARQALENGALNNQRQELQVELDKQRAVQAANEKVLRGSKTANDRAGAEESIYATKQRIKQIEVELQVVERERLTLSTKRADEEQRALSAITRQREEIDQQIKRIKGQDSVGDIQSRIRSSLDDTRNREFAATGSTDQTDALEAAQVQQAVIAKLEADYARLANAQKLAEEELQLLRQTGAISQEAAERRILALRLAAAGGMAEVVAQLQALAQTADPDTQARVARLDLQTRQLTVRTDELGAAARGAAQNGFSQLFVDIASGSKTAGEMLRNMLGNFAQQMLQLISQRLGAKLLESLFPSGGGGFFGGGGGGGGFISDIFSGFFHKGGVVGAGGSGASVPASVFNFAPRYHAGGIAGLKAREVPAVLQLGEEVLTADDPRHIKNFRGAQAASMGGLTVNVSVQGAKDTDQSGAASAELGGMVEAAVNTWAIKQHRPGGLFNKGKP